MEQKTIGAYTIKHYVPIFKGWGVERMEYYKGGKLIAYKTAEGWEKFHSFEGMYDMPTRAKGYRWWQEHFPDYYCWQLPEFIQMALDMEPRSEGEFISKKTGELVGYIG